MRYFAIHSDFKCKNLLILSVQNVDRLMKHAYLHLNDIA